MPRYSMTGKDGKLYTVDGPPGLNADIVRAEILKRAPQAGQASDAGGFIDTAIDTASGLVRGLGRTIGSEVSELVTEAPKILHNLPEYRKQREAEMYGAKAAELSARLAPKETPEELAKRKAEEKQTEAAWAKTTAPTAQAVQSFGKAIETSVPARTTPDWQHSQGFWGGLGSLAVSAAESATPTLAALATTVATRNPRLGTAVMGALSVPQTYSGIRQQQKQQGIDDTSRALIGTAASSAFDLYTGSAGAIAKLGETATKEALEHGAKQVFKEALKTGTEEGLTEGLQNVIEQVAGGADPTTKANMMQTLEAGLIGALMGTPVGAASARINQKREEAARAAPALHTENIMRADPTGTMVPEKLDILTAPNKQGLVVARDDVGNIQTVKVKDIEGMRAAPAEGEEHEPLHDILQRKADERKADHDFFEASKTAMQNPEDQDALQVIANRYVQMYGVQPDQAMQYAKASVAKARAPKAEEAGAEEIPMGAREFAPPEAYGEEPGMEPTVPPLMGAAPAVSPVNQAKAILDDTTGEALRQYADANGIDEEEAISRLTATASATGDTGMRYMRGRPAKTSADEGLFGNLPKQEEGRLSKEEELLQRKLELTPEERANQLTENMAAAQQRIEQAKQRDQELEAQRLAKMQNDIWAANKDNKPYEVQHHPGTAAPYRVVGPDGEIFVAEKNLGDFEEAVGDLPPYTPPPMSASAMEGGREVPDTPYTQINRDLVAEIAAARNAGKITQNEQATLMQQVADSANRKSIGAGEKAYREAMGLLRAAETDNERTAVGIHASNIASDLRKVVDNVVANPVRARLKSMIESRVDEQVGAKMRGENAKVQEALGRMEGENVAPEMTEQREAGIDVAEATPSKYMRPEKTAGGPPMVVPAEDVQGVVDQITAGWKSKVPVSVVSSIADLPENVQRAVEEDNAQNAFGFVAPDGTIYIIADNLTSIEDARAALFHEALGHLGLAKLFRNTLDNALVGMYENNAKLKADTDAWIKQNPDAYKQDKNPLARAVEEVLAERSEAGRLETSFFKKIATITRNFARRMGIKVALTDGDIAAILSMAHDQVVRGKQESTVVKGLRYMTAWHGSPHDFDKFTTKAIGSGEGHAAYGWGLYFADKRAVGEHYRNQEAVRRTTIDGQSMKGVKGRRMLEYGDGLTIDERSALIFLRNTGTFDYTAKRLQRDIDSKFSSEESKERAQKKLNTLIELRDSGRLQIPKGSLYEVQLAPNEDEWLDWKEPIKNQSPKVQEALTTLGFVAEPGEGTQYPLTGADVYNELRRQLGSKQAASLALLSAGIRGNRYLDAISRGPGVENPAYNYVLFDDRDVSISQKYMRPKKGSPEEKINRGTEDAQKAKPDGILAGLTEAAKGHIELARDAAEALETNITPANLAITRTDTIRDKIAKMNPYVGEAIKGLDVVEQKIRAMRTQMEKALSRRAREFTKFVNKFGQDVLSDMMNKARTLRVDVTAASSLDELIADDKVAKLYATNIADPALSRGQRNAYKGHYKNRVADLTEAWKAWEALGKQEGGQELYKQLRQFYKDMYTAIRSELDEDIRGSGMDAASAERLINTIHGTDDIEGDGDTLTGEKDRFPGVSQKLFPEEYFPFRRFGDYGLLVGGGDTGIERERHHFESAFERNRFERKRARELGLRPGEAGYGDVVKRLDGIEDLKKSIVNDSAMLTEMFDVINKSSLMYGFDPTKYSSQEESDTAAKEELKDKLYQTYLMTLPERSIRKQFIHAELIKGNDRDALRIFKNAVQQYSNQIPKLAYGREAQGLIDNAFDTIKSDNSHEAAMLRTLVNTYVGRYRDTINPKEGPNAVERFMSAFTFLQIMSSAVTAAVQPIAVPLQVMPRMVTRYGPIQTLKVMDSYLPVWEMANMFIDVDPATGKETFTPPSLGNTDAIKNNPLRAELWRRLNDERDLFSQSHTNMLLRDRRTKSYNPFDKAGDTFAQTVHMAGALIGSADQLAREVTGMTFAELHYRSLRKKGVPHQQALNETVEEAIRDTNETLGNFTVLNKPGVFKGNMVKRMIGYLRTYSTERTSYYLRQWDALTKGSSYQTRWQAFNELTSTMLLGALAGGASTVFSYSLVCFIIDQFLKATLSDEEKDRRRREDPLGAESSDYRFRNKWIPYHFGSLSPTATRIAQHGLLSEMTGADLGPRISQNDLWLRQGKDANTTVGTIANFLAANFSPQVSNVVQMGDALDDIAKGDLQRGLGKMMPNAVRGFINANRLGTEGETQRSTGRVVMAPSEFTEKDLNIIRAGAVPSKLAEVRERNRDVIKWQKGMEQERNDIMKDIKLMLGKPYTAEDAAKAAERMRKYNAKVPYLPGTFIHDPKYYIEAKDIAQSVTTAGKKAAKSVRGVEMTPAEQAYLQ